MNRLVARWLRGYERYIVMALWASQTKRYDVLLNSNVNRDMWCVMGEGIVEGYYAVSRSLYFAWLEVLVINQHKI